MLLVLKFGGTSVADVERIRNVAKHVQREVQAGHKVAVVVSAMSGVTNQLEGWVKELTDLTTHAAQAEHDTVLSSGEQVTSGLLALAIQELGIPARSWLGSQLPVKTEGLHAKARIESIDTKALHTSLNKGEVVVIPGFQGINEEGRITTLGRGGSDTSAVALAAALKADRCDIYTDVDGIYTTDPRLVPKARRLNKVGYEEMLEMASLGAKVLQTRSVEMGLKYNVPVMVRSSFSEEPGTLLTTEDEVMERRLITGVTYSKNDAQLTLINVENTPGVAANIFGPLAEAEINVDMIVQDISESGDHTNITFTIPKADVPAARLKLEAAQKSGKITYKSLLVNEDVVKVSVVGVGMRSHAGLAQTMFQTLADNQVNILVISTSEIKISVLIAAKHLETALQSLHTAYDLDAE